MASNEKFVFNPSKIENTPRSVFPMNNRYKAPYYHGDLLPIDILPVLPGDSFKYAIDGFIRTATPPIAPFMDSVWFSIAAFFVPERLVWDKMKEFYGENREGYGIQTAIYRPRSTKGLFIDKNSVLANPQSLAVNLGLISDKAPAASGNSPISVNEIRSFLQVYNDWFRNENFMAPYLWDHTQTGDNDIYIATLSGANIGATSVLPKVCKKLDRFTSCLPWAQKGNAVALPLAGSASITDASGTLSINSLDDFKLSAIDSSGETSKIFRLTNPNPMTKNNPGTDIYFSHVGSWTDDNTVTPGSDFKYAGGLQGSIASFSGNVDLSSATAATINQLRFAFATQRYFEALARGGSKYRETIYSLYGVQIGDTTAQMAEYLGGLTIQINIDQVTQTTGYQSGQGTELGAPGAVSLSATSEDLFTKSFDEPGFIVLVGYSKHQRTYGQGLEEMYQKNDILSYYNPKFAFIGEQPIPVNSVFFDGKKAKDGDSFGFQEAWSEYRYKRDVVIGALNPATGNSLDFWTLSDKFATAPTLGAAFLTENRDSIARCLSGGSASPDFFIDLNIRRTAVRPMPLNSTPGLIDHF